MTSICLSRSSNKSFSACLKTAFILNIADLVGNWTSDKGDYYNIGIDTPEISIKRLAEITIDHAKELFNYKGELVFGESSDVDYLTDNPNRRCPNITKAKNMIGYSPNIDVYDGVKRSLIWYSENYEEECEE